MTYTFVPIDLSDPVHRHELIRLLNTYMQDEMGNGAPMPSELAPKILHGLRNYPGYLGFFAVVDGQFAALANCNSRTSFWETVIASLPGRSTSTNSSPPFEPRTRG